MVDVVLTEKRVCGKVPRVACCCSHAKCVQKQEFGLQENIKIVVLDLIKMGMEIYEEKKPFYNALIYINRYVSSDKSNYGILTCNN